MFVDVRPCSGAMLFSRSPHTLFSAAGLLRHLKRGVFATWLYMVTQIPTEMAKFLPGCPQFLPRWPHDGGARICVGMTIQ